MRDKPKEVNEGKITGFLDKDTEFKGELSFKGSFRIDGHFQGTINSESTLIIGDKGKVEADVKVGNLLINGEVRGTIQARDRVEIHSQGRVYGTITTPKLVIEEGAYLEAKCQTTEGTSPVVGEAKDQSRSQA